jgi:signal transduction histidine kinase
MDSLRFRFVVGGLLWLVFAMVAAGLLISNIYRDATRGAMRDELGEHSFELEALLDLSQPGPPHLVRQLSDPRFSTPGSGFYWEVTRQGVSLLRSPSLRNASLSGPLGDGTPQLGQGYGPDGAAFVNGFARTGPDGVPIELRVAVDNDRLETTVADFNQALARSLIVFALLLVFGGIMLVSFGLRPLGKLRTAMADIRSGRLARLPDGFPTEIAPLVADLNAMLASTGDMVQRARVGAGNLAHGLRTPLAVQMDEAQRLHDAGATEAAETILHQCQRMQRQIDYHVARASAVGPSRLAGVNTMIAEKADIILSALARLHLARGVKFGVADDVDARLAVATDPTDLGEMLSALVDNAGKWASHQVLVRWDRAADDMIVISVDDDGPGLPLAVREQAFAIGERLDDVVPGSGLGLAIARDLARLYGGDAQLDDSPLGGLRAQLWLPIAR